MRERDFQEYRNGGSFSEFVRKTNREWFKLAKAIMTKHFSQVPPSMAVEDVVQIMLMACVRFTAEWEPGRGPDLKTHVVWRSCDKAIKAIHTELKTGRQGAGGPRTGAPRYEICFASIGVEGHRELLMKSTFETNHDDFVAQGEAKSDPIVAMFAELGDVDAVAWKVLGDQVLRERYGIRRLRTARRDVLNVIRARVSEVVL